MSERTELIARATAGFQATYGGSTDLVSFAPGRVNLIGEHTDYNDGFVLPCAIPFGTAVAIRRRDDAEIVATALDLDGSVDRFSLSGDVGRLPDGEWGNHVRGIASALPRFGMAVGGAEIAIAGNVPQGAGLSSSASLGVALALGLASFGTRNPDKQKLALAAQWSEHNYVGCACGIMDQLASASSVADHALLIDCRSLNARAIAMPAHWRVMIVHSGISRSLVDSEYNERRTECQDAAEHYGVAALRDLDCTALLRRRGGLDERIFRRARHVVSENARTLATADAIEAGDLLLLGQAMRASHASLRDDFQVSVPAIDDLVEVMNRAIGAEGGTRMTGGGFGGCVVAILPKSGVPRVREALADYWWRRHVRPQIALEVRPASGAILAQFERPPALSS